jgi:flavorubredoxin
MEKDIDIKTLELKPGIHWVGVLDYDIVTFDVVMETKYGTTYNSYFIDADKKTVVETVKESFWDTYITKLRSCTDPREIQYIILNHTEPDHSGCLEKLLAEAPGATVVGTGNAIRYLGDLVHSDFPYLVVKDGQTLDLGNKTLKFIGAPNLHWPDTMYTYLEEDRVLFSCDSFGAHFCDPGMFDDMVGVYDDAFRYYFDVILKPFSKFMVKAIEKISALPVSVVAPGHGPILRTNHARYVRLSEEMARETLRQRPRPLVYIPYVSAYHKTGLIAEMIAEGVVSAGDIDVEIVDIEKASVGQMEEQVARASGIIIGSTTINQNILLPVYKLFSVINPLRDKGKLAGAFGSYGWSGESRELIRSNLENLKLDFFRDGVFVKFTPGENDRKAAWDYGKGFGEALLNAGQDL